ncbi:MAG: acetylornithine deacetylase [Rhodospirillaceae bacterium]|mgnify:CR=1 FL=1|nr:acetylornithine deacetylase [Rhodospirillaceae bacterium]
MSLLETTISELSRLVGFPTVSKDTNLDLIHYVQESLDKLGITSTLIHNEENTKANLIATIGPNKAGGIVLSGHTDVVPVDGQNWHSNPFKMIEKNGKLFGRGTCDMKGFLAIALAATPIIIKESLHTPIHLAFSYDEEVGCLGARSLIKTLKKTIPLPHAVIVGEPTGMKVISAHKGITAIRTTIEAKEAHSSQTQLGVSAVMIASRLIAFIESMNEENAATNTNDQFEPNHTTMTVNIIDGGTAVNILAKKCSFIWDIRHLPNEDPRSYINRFENFCHHTVLPSIKNLAPNGKINIEVLAGTPALKPIANSPAETLCRQLTGDNIQRSVSFATEAGQFQEAKMSTAICGPGSIDQAHQPNEYLSLDQLKLGTVFIQNLIKKMSQP